MSVEELKRRLELLTATEQEEVLAFLSQLRHDQAENLDDDLLASADVRQATLDSFYDDPPTA